MTRFQQALESALMRANRNPAKALAAPRIQDDLTTDDLACAADCNAAEKLLTEKLASIRDALAADTTESDPYLRERWLRRTLDARRFAENALSIARAKREEFLRVERITAETRQDAAILDVLHRELPTVYAAMSAKAQAEKPELFADHIFSRKAS